MPVFFILFFFRLRYLQDCRADLYKIFQEDVKWAVIEKLSFLFLNFFGDGREVQ